MDPATHAQPVSRLHGAIVEAEHAAPSAGATADGIGNQRRPASRARAGEQAAGGAHIVPTAGRPSRGVRRARGSSKSIAGVVHGTAHKPTNLVAGTSPDGQVEWPEGGPRRGRRGRTPVGAAWCCAA